MQYSHVLLEDRVHNVIRVVFAYTENVHKVSHTFLVYIGALPPAILCIRVPTFRVWTISYALYLKRENSFEYLMEIIVYLQFI